MDMRVARGLSTRSRLVDTATLLFARDGYDATSIEAVLAASRTSRGALYHHFASKEALFEAVLDDVEALVVERLRGATKDATSATEAVVSGCRAFIRLARDRTVRQIVLLDAPTVVGWQRWREIDGRHAFGLLRGGIAAAAAPASIPDDLVDPIAHVVLASLLELALIVASSKRPQDAIRRAEEAIELVVRKVLASVPEPGVQ